MSRSGPAVTSPAAEATLPIRPLIVAVGISRDGQDALHEFLIGLGGCDIVLDSVVIIMQSVAVTGSVVLEDLLGLTKLALIDVDSSCVLQAGSLYLVPAGYRVSIKPSILEFNDAKDFGTVGSEPIDSFFYSLVDNRIQPAAGVLLGEVDSDSDGSKGLSALKRAGALTLTSADLAENENGHAAVSQEKGIACRLPARSIGEVLVSLIRFSQQVFQARDPELLPCKSEIPETSEPDSSDSTTPDTGVPASLCTIDMQQAMNRILLEEFAPPSVIVDASNRILIVSGDAQKYLNLQVGATVVEAANEGIRTGLSAVLEEFKCTGQRTVRDALELVVDDMIQSLTVIIQAMPDTASISTGRAMITFLDVGHPVERASHEQLDKVAYSEAMLRRSLIAADMDAFHLNLEDQQMLRQGALFNQLGLPQSLNNKDYLARIHPEDRWERQAMIERCTPGQPQYSYTYRFSLEDGRVRWLSEEGEVQFDATGQRQILDGTCRDISDARHYEEMLLAREREALYREEHLRRVIDHQLGLVGIIDLDGILLEVDNTSMSIAGASRDEVIGKHFADTSFWNYDKAVSQRIREAMHRAYTGEAVRFDIPLGSGNGKTLMIDFMLAPLYDKHGAVEFLIPSGVDISERNKAEQALIASENQLRAGVAVANLALAEIDYLSDTAFLTVEAARLYGLDESDLCVDRKQLHRFIPDEDRERVQLMIDKQLASPGEDAIHCQHRVQSADGSLRWLEVRMQFYFSDLPDERQLAKGILAARDITEQKSADGRLRESENRFRNMVNDLPNLVWVHDEKGHLQTVNRTFREFFGIGVSRWDEDNWQEVIHPDDVEEYVREFQLCVDQRRVFRAQARVRNAKGQWRWLESVGLPRISDSGEFLGFAGSSSDVTSQHEFEDSLREARRAAEVANESKSAFIANMSHEIRTPMSAVLGYTELLSMEEKDPEKLEFLSIIRRNGHFLLDIINDILDLSKVEAGKLDIDNTAFAVQDVVTDVLSMMKVRAGEKNLSFNVEYRSDIPATINSDPRRLQQILVNLIGNAVKFTEKGGVKLLVTYGKEDSSRLHFSVVDSGIGMSREIQSRLFTPFSQGDDSVSRVFGGTGLGLAISQRLARLLGGEIVVDSEAGRGSCFSFTIAVGDVSDQSLISVNSDYSILVDSYTKNDISLNCCVLVVDDQRDVRIMVKRFLEKASATVCTAEDGVDALSLVRQSMATGSPVIDLILLDMQMPRLDGYSTARQLREMGFIAPVVALTADALQADMSVCLVSGCDAYLSKPVDSLDLLTTIRHYTQEVAPEDLIEQRRRLVASVSQAESENASQARERQTKPVEPRQSESTGLQALIVDDAVDVCRSLQRLLQRKGIRAECAHDGEGALQSISRIPPDIVILDINLPDMSGLELVSLMRNQLDSAATRFIALSGHVGRENHQRSLAAGFDTHLEKPLDISQLLTAINVDRSECP